MLFRSRAGAPWWKNTAQLRLGGVLAAQVVISLQQRPVLQDVPGRDPALRQPALGQQHPQVPGVGLVFSELAIRHLLMLFVGFIAGLDAGWRAARPLW